MSQARTQRLTAVQLAPLLLVALLAVGCKTELLHDLPEGDAARMLAVLQQHGIQADKKLVNPDENLWALTVPGSSSARAFAILAEYKLPMKEDRRFRDVFGKSQLVPTPPEQQALFLEALQGEIAHTLRSLPGVISARVHVVQPERDAANRPLSTSKASVLIEFQPSAAGLPPISNGEVRQLVANAVPELGADNVSVVQKPASIAQPSTARGASNLVSFGPLVLEEGGLLALKLGISLAIVLLAGLAWTVAWQGRLIGELREKAVDKGKGGPRGGSLVPSAREAASGNANPRPATG
jgi:type III secretion protein J